VENNLRERVVLRVDGGLRSGRDVMLTAALGADEYGFGTVAMIATGCIMARVCHTNNCPVGVASQREELRARFPGAPADLVSICCCLTSTFCGTDATVVISTGNRLRNTCHGALQGHA
jgi:glutamate synthase domain-containing protein 2